MILTAALLCCLAPQCSAITHQQIVADGTEAEFSFTSAYSASEPFAVYFTSPGIVSLAVEVGVDGPPGLAGKVEGALLGKGAWDDMSIDRASLRWEEYKIIAQGAKGRKEYASFVIDPSSDGGAISFIYHLHKDACLSREDVVYGSRLVLDLSAIPQAQFEKGFTIRVALREYNYPGSQVASIKPASDGKYRGEPILLMGTMQYGGEYVNIIRRSNGRVRSRRRIPVVKYVSHRGQALSLARLQGVLRGGRATFELSNGGAIYGVCFSLERRRQFANGYKL
jgi:hypothetical protein